MENEHIENNPGSGQPDDQPSTPVAAVTNEDRWCFCCPAGIENPDFKERAALLSAAKWPGIKPKIEISFLDGDPAVQEKVKKTALLWTAPGMANVDLVFRKDTTDTDVRISFEYKGSWSLLGTTCKRQTDKTLPTMNFGWLKPESTDEEIRRVVLHEFGHALGLIHEHMSPAGGGIQWNKPKVIQDLSGPPNKWNPDVIENNMFKGFAAAELELTPLDKDSIMMYPIPSKWTLDGFNVGLNTNFSETDKKAIRKMYPGNNALFGGH